LAIAYWLLTNETMTKQEKREAEQLRDAALIQQHRDGDAKAFDQLEKLYKTPLYWYSYKKLGNRQDAEDAAQEVFIRAVEAIANGNYKENVPFGGWLYTTARNYIEHIQKKKKPTIKNVEELPEVMMEETESKEEIKEKRKRVRSLFKGLSLSEAKLMLLRYWHKLKWKEIAKRLKITEKYASGLHSKIIKKFQKKAGENIFLKNGGIF